MRATVEAFIKRRLSVVVGINDDLFATEEDNVVEIHVPDVGHAGEKDISVSGPANGKIFHIAISIAVCQVCLKKSRVDKCLEKVGFLFSIHKSFNYSSTYYYDGAYVGSDMKHYNNPALRTLLTLLLCGYFSFQF